MNINRNRIFLLISLSIIAIAVVAGRAAEMNAKFQELVTAVNDNEGRISLMEAEQAELVAHLHKIYAIGETGPGGGIVFYTDFYGRHGFEYVVLQEAQWGCIGTEISGADGTALGTGAQNTVDILAGCNEPGIAAAIANNHSQNGYSDWFLPASGADTALDVLLLGGLNPQLQCWGSTEGNANEAWTFDFVEDDSGFRPKDTGFFCVLAVRSL